MNNKITGKEYPLSKVFSKDFDYNIPAYQRPYAWGREETEKLFNDLLDFYYTENDDNFFLGSIVLIKEDEIPYSEVIDGQQRLTTLTILLASIASRLTGDSKDNCIRYLKEPGNELEDISPKPRLHLRQKDNEFFKKYIQNLKLDELESIDSERLANESQKHIQQNCIILRNLLKSSFTNESEIKGFCKFLVTRCYIVVVSTSNQKSAFRIFSVMNSRGLNLLPIDIIKSDTIGQILPSEQQTYTDKWEDLEIQTTRLGFNEVFTHTRMIFAKTKSKQNLLEEFRTAVIPKTTPKELIDDILEPYSDAYSTLTKRNYEATRNSEQINKYLFWLNKLDFSDWMPVAIKFYAEHKDDSDYLLWFISKLERLSSFLHISAKDINHRIERYSKILEEMEINTSHSIDDKLQSIELTRDEKKEFVKCLNGNVYGMTGKRRNYIVLRLNDFVSDGAARFEFEPNVLTIEHVLPQTISPNSEWAITWNDPAVRELWINRIANLVPLTRKKNSQAQNFDFETKKEKYFKGKNCTTTYPLTTQVISEQTWTPQVVEKRQEMLINCFIQRWDLTYTEESLNDNSQRRKYYIRGKRGANAAGIPFDDGVFTVIQGSKVSSEISNDFEHNYPNAFRLRNKLCENQIITDNIFISNYDFSSISLAASVVLGRNASGPKEWVNSNNTPYEQVEMLENTPQNFNIDDDSTFRFLSVGTLAFQLFKKIFELEKISEHEINLLKGKDYTKSLFSRTNFPVLADNRNDNMGQSNVIRYKKEPLLFKGKQLFFTTQWYEENRNDVITWYKKHL